MSRPPARRYYRDGRCGDEARKHCLDPKDPTGPAARILPISDTPFETAEPGSPAPPGPWPPPPSPGRAGWTGWLAWVVILGVALLSILANRSPSDPGNGDEDVVGLILVQLQGKYLIGAGRMLPGNAALLYTQAEGMLNIGSLGQRQRFVVMAAELAGPAEARRKLDELDRLIDDPPLGKPLELTEAQAASQRALHQLYPSELEALDDQQARVAAASAASALSASDRDALEASLGWFGRLAVVGSDTDDRQTRDGLLATATAVAIVMVTVAALAIGAAFVGFAGLVLLIVMTFTGRLTSGLGIGRAPHTVYAETFAVWFVLFAGIQELVGLVPGQGLHMVLVVVAFPASLVALAWPVLRGTPWRDVRQDIGLTLGDRPWLEPLIGFGGYLATLPLLAVGLVITLGLMAMQQSMAGAAETFAPAGGPAHPVITYMSGPDLGPKLLVLLLAAVAAPLVEETVFRGVLYRHLRGATGRFGTVLSVIVSTLLNTLLFAAIHPQGWVAMPALMGLATGMTLVREWRGTLVPSMVIHGLSNALVMSMLWILLAV